VFPASPKNKKKNHARRLRSEGVRLRLAEEKKKAEERAARIQRREEQRERRRNTPRVLRRPFSEDPVRIQLREGSNHWRLLRRSDLGRYVVRRAPGKIRRVWVQPTWLGKCSPREFLNEQSKYDVPRFLNCAIKAQTSEKSDFVQDFIENPYFSRPRFLDSGRVSPETAQVWRLEDDIESSKDTGKWSSVANRIEKRRREGQKRCQCLGKNPATMEEISHLTVNCDFQEVDAILPPRPRERSPERGFYYAAANSKLPIEGPKTLKEVEEDQELIRRMPEYMDS
jgi:hypothetical protein